VVQSQPGQIVHETLHKKGVVEWLKVKALSSSPSTTSPSPPTTRKELYYVHAGCRLYFLKMGKLRSSHLLLTCSSTKRALFGGRTLFSCKNTPSSFGKMTFLKHDGHFKK
jgi:hypothetical protein